MRTRELCSTSDRSQLCMTKKLIEIEQMPSYQRLKIVVRRHVDQMIRTRNFRARNERIETGVRVKRQKREESQCGKENGSMLSVESKWTVFKRRLLQFQPRE